MAVHEIDERATTSGSPAAVWELLDDSASWTAWTPIDTHENVRAAGEDGLGEIRSFRNGRVTVREEIVERQPETRLSYALLAGLPLRDYRAEIDLTPVPGGGTEIRWHTTFAARVPGTGWLYRRVLRKATRQFVDGLARHSAAV